METMRFFLETISFILATYEERILLLELHNILFLHGQCLQNMGQITCMLGISQDGNFPQ